MDRKQVMIGLRKQKHTLQFIANKYGLSRERVRQIIGNTGYAAFSPFYRKEELQEVQKYFACTMKDVAKLYYLNKHEIINRQKKSAGNIRLLRKNKNVFRCNGCFMLLPKSSFYETKKPLEKINGLRCKKCTRKHAKKYNKINNQKIESTPYGKLKRRAYSRVQWAINSGKLIRPSQCEKHNKDCHGIIEANHWHGYDYAHQLDVQWLCTYHHHKIDKVGFKYIKH